MHRNNNYTNAITGKYDHHAQKMAGKSRDQNSEEMHDLKRLTDGGEQLSYKNRVHDTLNVKVEGMSSNRKSTKLALTGNLSMRPYQQEVGLALKNERYSLVPTEQLLPAPMQQPLAIAA